MTTIIITLCISLVSICFYESYRDDEMHRQLREIKKEQKEELKRNRCADQTDY